MKALSHIYTPVSQFMMFESLDSLHESPNNEDGDEFNRCGDTMEMIYGKEIVEELRRMRVFMVGSGAIGCELLKNFALMGVGEGVVEIEEKELVKEEQKGFWSEGQLSNGGVLVTDMDNIERSNLNRQLLFRY